MKLAEVAIAVLMAAVVVAIRFLPGEWCEPWPVRVALAGVVALAAAFYIVLVDGERRKRVTWWHRVAVGALAGLVVAVIADGSSEVYVLSVLLGVMLGYGGNYLLGWLKHV